MGMAIERWHRIGRGRGDRAVLNPQEIGRFGQPEGVGLTEPMHETRNFTEFSRHGGPESLAAIQEPHRAISRLQQERLKDAVLPN